MGGEILRLAEQTWKVPKLVDRFGKLRTESSTTARFVAGITHPM